MKESPKAKPQVGEIEKW